MLNTSWTRWLIAADERMQARCLILALDRAHMVLNGEFPLTEEQAPRMAAKAAEIINSPKEFKEKIALSVAARLPSNLLDFELTDEALISVVADVLDGMAGIRML